MSLTLLQTKLFAPRARPRLVRRDQLLGRLHNTRPLTLVSAPAGFGKTTLIIDWLARSSSEREKLPTPDQSDDPHGSTFDSQSNVAWLSLDEDDNDPTRWLSYLVAALQTCHPNLGATALALLAAPQAPSPKAILTSLLHDLGAITTPLLLVLDDYHLIGAQPIHDALAFLIDHLPPTLRLVITSRVDPPLPLARWRVRNQLLEVRADDLRFSAAESATFLNDAMGLALSPAEIAALDLRTEGWIAGLQLAALSMQGRSDTASFIQAFSGSHRHVLSYLVEEVLDRRPDGTLEFLLQTSILQRMSADLCNAITGRHDSQQLLERLEQANLFLIPLDDLGTWYRYHHLFADVLRNRLRQSNPVMEIDLQRRASDWCAGAGLLEEAMHHALAAADLDRATAIIEQHGVALLMRSQVALVNGWLRHLPAALIDARPQLALVSAWVYMTTRDLDALERMLNHIPALQAADLNEGIQGQLLILRACGAVFRGDFEQTVAYARQGLQLVPAAQPGLRATALLLIGSGLAQTNDRLAAEPILLETIAVGKVGGNLYNAMIAYYILSRFQSARGDVAQAFQTLHEALATQVGQAPIPAVGLIYIGLGALWVDQGRYEQAEIYLQRGEALAKACFELIELLYGWRAQVRLYLAQGAPDRAARVLDAAEDLLRQIVVPQFMREHLSSSLRSTRATITRPAAPAAQTAAFAISQALIEPLSARELEVLALVSAGLSNSDIARKLIVTVGTVKKHLNHIFGKLGVSSRTQAIGRARELGLLPS